MLTIDIRSSGRVLNEYSADGATFTFAATGAVYREYARELQRRIHGLMSPELPRFGIGAPECLAEAGAREVPERRVARPDRPLEARVRPLHPDADDIAFTGLRSGRVTVRYKDRLSMVLLPEAANVQELVFRR